MGVAATVGAHNTIWHKIMFLILTKNTPTQLWTKCTNIRTYSVLYDCIWIVCASIVVSVRFFVWYNMYIRILNSYTSVLSTVDDQRTITQNINMCTHIHALTKNGHPMAWCCIIEFPSEIWYAESWLFLSECIAHMSAEYESIYAYVCALLLLFYNF